MPMEEDLRTALKAAIGGAVPVDWGWNAQGITPPRVVLVTVSGDDPVAHDGPVGLIERRVQVDCFAATPKAARDLGAAVRGLNGYRAGNFAGVFVAAVRDGLPDTPGGEVLARVSIDLRVIYRE
jgi:hypothetical protein